MPLPAEYYARCTDTGCSWQVTVTAACGEDDPAAYRDMLAERHRARYGHATRSTDYA